MGRGARICVWSGMNVVEEAGLDNKIKRWIKGQSGEEVDKWIGNRTSCL